VGVQVAEFCRHPTVGRDRGQQLESEAVLPPFLVDHHEVYVSPGDHVERLGDSDGPPARLRDDHPHLWGRGHLGELLRAVGHPPRQGPVRPGERVVAVELSEVHCVPAVPFQDFHVVHDSLQNTKGPARK